MAFLFKFNPYVQQDEVGQKFKIFMYEQSVLYENAKKKA